MVFRRRMSRLSPINRTKHVIDSSGGSTNVASVTVLYTGTERRSATPFTPGEVVLGSTVNAVYLSFYVIGSTGAPLDGPIDWYIAKARVGQDPTTDFPDPGATGPSNIRSQIFHEEKGLSGSGDGTPMVFKGVIAIPKAQRRIRVGDQLFIKLIATGTDVNNFCIKCIFNEFQ